jgi:hypothetical protein
MREVAFYQHMAGRYIINGKKKTQCSVEILTRVTSSVPREKVGCPDRR